jgi:hypothetical protein
MTSRSTLDGCPSGSRNVSTLESIIRHPQRGHGNKTEGRDERPMFEPIQVLQLTVLPGCHFCERALHRQ